MATIKTNFSGGFRNIITKVDGARSVSCSCCEFPVVFSIKTASSFCDNNCGFVVGSTQSSPSGTTPPTTTPAPCPYQIQSIVEIDGQQVTEPILPECAPRYKVFKRKDDYTAVQGTSTPCSAIFPNKVEEFQLESFEQVNGVNQQTGIVNITCSSVETQIQGTGSYPGQQRTTTWQFFNPTAICFVLYNNFGTESFNNSSVVASHIVSKDASQSSAIKKKYRIREEDSFIDDYDLKIITTTTQQNVISGSCFNFENGTTATTETVITGGGHPIFSNDGVELDAQGNYYNFGVGGGQIITITGEWIPK